MFGVDGQGVFDRLVNIEVEKRQEIDLVDDHDAACVEHVRIFERLVFAFSHRKDGDLRLLRAGRTELDRPDCRRRLTQNPLEPIRKDAIHKQRLGLVSRLSMMRIMARRTKAATVVA